MSFTQQFITRFLMGSVGLLFGFFLLWHDEDPFQVQTGMWFCLVSILYLLVTAKRYIKF